ncbi:hypothetical protein FO519_004244 [Halicephalobus sp. NKZ332]|nr:hypothetical protein FO519_004244 [Halicephalobus sp. NKZ332]
MSTINDSRTSLEKSGRSRTSDIELRKAIWGPFYYITQMTGLVLHIAPEDIKSKKGLLHLIPNVLATLILLANGIYCLIRMSNIPFSINWAYSNSLFFFALHGFVSSLVMMGYKYKNYFSNVGSLLRKAARNNFENRLVSRPRRILGLFSFTTMIVSMGLYCADTYVMYPITVTLPEQWNVSTNDTQFFRKSMFGYQPLFCLDTVIKVYSMMVSASCLFIYACANGASCTELNHFNTQLKEKITDKSILKLEIMEIFETQLTDFLVLIKFITENAVGVISISFVAGLMVNILSYYALRAFQDYLLFGQLTFYFWVATSTIFLIFACLKVGDFYSLLRETNDLLNLSHEIQKEAPDDRIRQIVRDMIERINTVDYASKNIFSVKSGMTLFHFLMLGIPFVMEFFVRVRYVPEFLPIVIANS